MLLILSTFCLIPPNFVPRPPAPTRGFKSDEKVSWISWLYQEGPSHGARISFTFDKKNHDLLSKTFEVRSDDPEIDVDTVKAKYKALKKRELAWTNPHIAPDEVCFENELKGISIEMRKTRREVAAITWYDPKIRPVALAAPDKCVKYTESSGLISCLTRKVTQRSLPSVPHSLAKFWTWDLATTKMSPTTSELSTVPTKCRRRQVCRHPSRDGLPGGGRRSKHQKE